MERLTQQHALDNKAVKSLYYLMHCIKSGAVISEKNAGQIIRHAMQDNELLSEEELRVIQTYLEQYE